LGDLLSQGFLSLLFTTRGVPRALKFLLEGYPGIEALTRMAKFTPSRLIDWQLSPPRPPSTEERKGGTEMKEVGNNAKALPRP